MWGHRVILNLKVQISLAKLVKRLIFCIVTLASLPDIPDGCKVIGRNFWQRLQHPHKLLQWVEIFFKFFFWSLSDMQKIYAGGFSCVILFSHNYFTWSRHCRTTCLQFMSWNFLLHIQYSSLWMVQDATDVPRISWFASLVAITELFFIVTMQSEENPHAEWTKGRTGVFYFAF